MKTYNERREGRREGQVSTHGNSWRVGERRRASEPSGVAAAEEEEEEEEEEVDAVG